MDESVTIHSLLTVNSNKRIGGMIFINTKLTEVNRTIKIMNGSLLFAVFGL